MVALSPRPHQGPGVFIAFEGADASGKSTQIGLLAERLRGLGHEIVVTREPGGTAVGKRIRALVLDHSDEGAVLSPRAEALLMAADRAQHVAEVIRPALAAGRVVLADRYLGSSIAYQGIGRGLGADAIERLSLWATEDLLPTITVVIKVPVEVSLARLNALGSPDRLESIGPDFVRRVSAAYDELATRPATVAVSGLGTPDEVAQRVWSAVAASLPGSSNGAS
jgi:dTMP kinase